MRDVACRETEQMVYCFDTLDLSVFFKREREREREILALHTDSYDKFKNTY